MDATLLYHALREAVPVVEWSHQGRGIGIRCPYCGDSTKNPTNWHMNIKTDSDVFVFRCVRCGMSGKVTPRFLQDVSCYDLTVLRQAAENKKLSFTKSGKRSIRKKNVQIPITNDPTYSYKLDYLNSRLHSNFTPETAKDYNIVLSLKELAHANPSIMGMLNTEKKYRLYDDLDLNWIGFMTSDGMNVSFRNIRSDWSLRYYDLNFVPTREGESCYVIQHPNISLTKPEIVVGITEGAIDAIGVWAYHVMHGEYIDAIVAPMSKNYFTPIQHTWFSTGRLDTKFKLFADSEIKSHEYADMVEFITSLKVYKNRLADDFGHPVERIWPVEQSAKTKLV